MKIIKGPRLLAYITHVIMISEEGIESTQLHPSVTELLTHIIDKATGIRPNQSNTVHIEIHHLGY